MAKIQLKFSKTGQKLSLRALPAVETPTPEGAGAEFAVSGVKDSTRLSAMLSRAAQSLFGMHDTSARMAARRRGRRVVDPAVYRETGTGLMRVVYKEIAVRFQPRTSASVRNKILKKFGFEVRQRGGFARDQYTIRHATGRKVTHELLDVAQQMDELDEVMFASPNFVSEYDRLAVPKIHPQQWHLKNKGNVAGTKAGADAKVQLAWATTTGKPGIVIAVLDDGIDIDHPNLKGRIKKNPDPNQPKDKYGRDFFVPDTMPDHFDPRPKLFQFPYHKMAGNDIHGTPCAGVVAADGAVSEVRGAAPKCKILPVKVFHADSLASDANVANAIRYAARFSDILSCSWSSGYSPDIEAAINIDAAAERGGKGVAIFCATGNSGGSSVSFPARASGAIAVGASTDSDKLASYSQKGPQVSVVAPSSGGKRGIYTTDVAYPNRGFNVGSAAAGGADGLHTNSFGGTSSATPLAAGTAALVLSVNGNLKRDEVRDILQSTADKIGNANEYNASGHSKKYGYGRINAKKAVAKAQTPNSPPNPNPGGGGGGKPSPSK